MWDRSSSSTRLASLASRTSRYHPWSFHFPGRSHMPIKLTNHVQLRTIRFAATGTITEEELEQVAGEARKMSQSYAGRKHLILADIRGMKVASNKVAERLGELIAYQRANGVSLCVHL